jgi:hypothetical protein
VVTADAAAPGGRPIRFAFAPGAIILFIIGLALTAWPSGSVGLASAGLALLWIGGVIAGRHSGPMIRFGGTFFLASAIWAALGFGFPGSFTRWPAADDANARTANGTLPVTIVDDPKYKGLVALVASVRTSGGQFVVTNESTQPWENATFTIVGAAGDEYEFRVDEIAPGKSAGVAPARFTRIKGGRFNPQRARPRTLIVTAEIGAGGPTGIYAVRL